MEQTALRPKPMPGQEHGGTKGREERPARRPHAARRRGRRLTTLLFGTFVGIVLVLSGVGLGTVGTTVIAMSRLAELQHRLPPRPPAPSARPAPTRAPAPPAPAGATLGVEAVDAEKAGALVVGVHVPGPGYTAGLVRGDVLLTFGDARVDTAADLVRAVGAARQGRAVTVTVRHESGAYQQLSVVPGVVT
ncbi:PDZ domain-containing protein [Streptomyces sp. NPDC053367]|uniref:PDZ domain-containing protein n=1 Tax=Streptomyces sp. NPDC053367 TaxID=3365700 RepID=UPI0037D2A49E